ncbi:MAG: precorrin-8X methylmutase [Lachnospiraceae bacterium]|nr:precorrin-8X methylmutase [Lachnospiraceae bacterium]
MKTEFEQITPQEIEARSFEIISAELGELELEETYALVLKRVIHTTADFDYARNLVFSQYAVEHALEALRKRACIVTDTQMALAGINKKALKKLEIEVYNFMSDADVAEAAKRNQTTRAAACMDKAAAMERPMILAVGNAPTALIRIYELVQQGKLRPELIIGVPVGFVNVVPAKEQILTLPVPYIVARGRKGGSNVAAAIVNALLYLMI